METKRERGRPEGKNFEFIKSIKLNQKQVENWDSKRIKAFLDGSNDSIEINKLKGDFKRLYQIMNVFLLPKINDIKIAEIPNSVLEELEVLEEGYDFE